MTDKPERKTSLTLEEAQSALMRAARNVGRIYGVGLSVGERGGGLIFVDDIGDPVIDDFAPQDAIVACNAAELADGSFLKLFAARSLYAALALKIMEIIESEAAP